ncbi:MAG: PTS-dependent dihydroxyacetone kinase phosphotransferase subunit DhaM [Negativicutes bacterium]|jgi:PTS hybrid protein|nr:PTS-dependent dihydroxyacetone kinase phosphotransferase subunit DhaM [Negativicutes bacterium]MBP8629875.1 PTS-dependent dihydroxyacetone kinase phosphotransferase subunit DhaM [Negativicutes bacterium]MBP9948927.1 PTS-dependent dihydroxyacetone kinase phosphotransferase subunit DhaM [Negativicutes bacterium]
MVGIVIVSHSSKVAEGIREMALQMANPDQKIIAAGGTDAGGIGTDAVKILNAINEADDGDGVVLLVDLGSAVLSAEVAMEMLEEIVRERVRIADTPILEGSISAVVEASIGSPLEAVVATAEEAREINKLQ